MKRISLRFFKHNPLQFASYGIRDLWIASFAGVRGAITLAGVLSIPLFLTDGTPFPGRYQLVFLAAGVILFSLLVGVVALPLLLRGVEITDSVAYREEELMAKSVSAEVAIESLKKMQERLEADTEENIDPQLLTEVSSRVIGSLRRRVMTKENADEIREVENLSAVSPDGAAR